MSINDKNIIVEATGSYHYIFNDRVYECLFYDDDVWINFNSLTKILQTDESLLKKAFENIYSRGFDAETHKYYFNDGNRQSYMSGKTNYFNLNAVVALVTEFPSYALVDYVVWARKTTKEFFYKKEASAHLFNEKNAFVYVNKFEHPVQDVIVPHKHNCYELIYYVKGKGKTACESGMFEYKPGTLFLVKPFEMHEEYVTEPSECICLAFNTDFSLPTGVIYESGKNSGDVEQLRNSVCEIESASGQKDNERNTENAVILVAYLINKLTQTAKENRFSDATVDYVKKYIDLNFSYKINFAILAERIGYSLSHLNYLFKQKEGMPMYTYLSNVRLIKAKQMLRGGSDSPAIISRKCGFSSESRFSQFFKEKTGVSPQMYRRISNVEVENGVLTAGKMKH